MLVKAACPSMRLVGALHPIEALSHREIGGRFMGGEVVGETNHAVSAGTAEAAGN